VVEEVKEVTEVLTIKVTCPELDKSAGIYANAAKGSAHAAADNDDDEDNGVFVIEYTTDSDFVCSIPGLLPMESSNEDDEERSNFVISNEDWFSEIDENDLPSVKKPYQQLLAVEATQKDPLNLQLKLGMDIVTTLSLSSMILAL